MSEKFLPKKKGESQPFEKFHHKMRLDISLVDRLKVLIGGKIDLSLCGKINVYLQEDKKYHYMKFRDTQTVAIVWVMNEPEEVGAYTKFAMSERQQVHINKLKE